MLNACVFRMMDRIQMISNLFNSLCEHIDFTNIALHT